MLQGQIQGLLMIHLDRADMRSKGGELVARSDMGLLLKQVKDAKPRWSQRLMFCTRLTRTDILIALRRPAMIYLSLSLVQFDVLAIVCLYSGTRYLETRYAGSFMKHHLRSRITSPDLYSRWWRDQDLPNSPDIHGLHP